MPDFSFELSIGGYIAGIDEAGRGPWAGPVYAAAVVFNPMDIPDGLAREINDSKKSANKAGFFSKRFAAKEAFSKALGTGFRNGLNFKDVSIVNDKFGKPFIKKSNKIRM